jgi:hypothetical protein
MFWQRSNEGEIFVDHRASPGLPEDIARKAGYDPRFAGEGKVFEAATLLCSHCGGRWIKNTSRIRERATCLKCSNHYICDLCDAARRAPDYIHRPFCAVIEETLSHG